MEVEFSNFLTNHARIKNLAGKVFLFVDLSSNIFHTEVSYKS